MAHSVSNQPQFDLSSVIGNWISAAALAGGIPVVRNRQHEGSLLVKASGYGERGPWDEVAAKAVFAESVTSDAGCAFIAIFDRDQASTQFQAYQALGLLTGHAFHRFSDGRRDYFTREMYVRDGFGRPAAREFPAALRTGSNAPGELAGTWACLIPASMMRLRTLRCTVIDSGLQVRAQSAGRGEPVDLGTAVAQLYADATRPDEPPAFLATFDHGDMRVHLQARINRGILVVCEFTEFTDGSGRSSYFIRETFRR